MNLFDQIFGTTDLFGSPTEQSRKIELQHEAAGTCTLIDLRLFTEGKVITTFRGKLYLLTAEEVDTASIKTKTRAESTSTADSPCAAANNEHTCMRCLTHGPSNIHSDPQCKYWRAPTPKENADVK